MKFKNLLTNSSNYAKTFYFPHLIIFLVGFALFISPFVVDYNTLPKGFELPKVAFWQAFSIAIILLSLLYSLFNILKTRKVIIPKSLYFITGLVILLYITTSLSPYPKMSMFGNEFRDQGFLTHTLVVLLAYVVYKFTDKKNWHFLALAFILSSVVQAIVGLTQFIPLVQTNPSAILEGLWINGTFGQANWFAGRLMLGVIFSTFYLKRFKLFKIKKQNNISNFLLRIFFLLTIAIILVAMGLSLSVWAITSIGIALIIIILYEIFSTEVFFYILYGLILIGVVLAFVMLRFNTVYNFRIDIWQNIINIIFSGEANAEYFKRLLFGYGFDTLGEVFKTFGRLSPHYVDRAHNFFLDILVQMGLSVLILLGYLFFQIAKQFKNLLSSRKSAITLIALLIWLFRSCIHESGIVNLVDFLVILAITLNLSNFQEPSAQ